MRLTREEDDRVTALVERTKVEAGEPITVLDAAVLQHDVAVIVFQQGNLTRAMIDIGPQEQHAAPGATSMMNMIVKARRSSP